jgi:hypothetical protein
MRLIVGKKIAVLFASLFLVSMAADRVSTATPPLPNPVLVFIGQEPYQANGKQWMRYKYTVDNLAAYPNELFASAPELAPCGTNTKSSRTWVDIYRQDGKRIYGFCALGNHDDLGKLWFALEVDAIPPSWIYIELNDRKTNTKYKSNLADTTN